MAVPVLNHTGISLRTATSPLAPANIPEQGRLGLSLVLDYHINHLIGMMPNQIQSFFP